MERSTIWQKQLEKVCSQDGFVAALDHSLGSTPKVLRIYGISVCDYFGESEMLDKAHEMRSRILRSPSFDGSRILGAILFEDTLDRGIENMPAATYLWERKGIVPFLKIDRGLEEERGGVQLMKDIPRLDELLETAREAGIFGTKTRSAIKLPKASGIKAIVDQQIRIGRRALAEGLIPILEPEISIHCPCKALCERVLFDALMAGLRSLEPHERVMLRLTLPTEPNLYMPLMAHPNVIRVLALSGGYSQVEACELLTQNVGMLGGFEGAFLEGLRVDQSEEEFQRRMDVSCEAIHRASRCVPKQVEQVLKLSGQRGFFVDLCPSEEEEARRVGVIEAVVCSRVFNGSRILGAFLSEEVLGSDFGDVPAASHLWERQRVVPLVSIDMGLEDTTNCVQLVKETPRLEAALARAAAGGAVGAALRSVVRAASQSGIEASQSGIEGVVGQQFELGKRALAHGLVPILQPEVDETCPEKDQCERLLLRALLMGLAELAPDHAVLLRLAIPVEPNLYEPLASHPRVLRVMLQAGGLGRGDACEALAKNTGAAACFGRQFMEGLGARLQQPEKLDDAVDAAAEIIYQASCRSQAAAAEASRGTVGGA